MPNSIKYLFAFAFIVITATQIMDVFTLQKNGDTTYIMEPFILIVVLALYLFLALKPVAYEHKQTLIGFILLNTVFYVIIAFSSISLVDGPVSFDVNSKLLAHKTKIYKCYGIGYPEGMNDPKVDKVSDKDLLKQVDNNSPNCDIHNMLFSYIYATGRVKVKDSSFTNIF